MRLLFVFTLFLNFGIVFGKGFSYPVIQNEGQAISGFIPDGWVIRDSVSGDLNKDKTEDVALVLQYKDSVNIVKVEDGVSDTVTTQPRILLVLFRNTLNSKYTLSEKSNSFILNHDNPNMEDPYQSIKIKNGILQIAFQLFYNMGSWDVTNSLYKFRYQNNQFELIGAENNTFNRASQDFENYSFNFLSKRWSVTKGNEDLKKASHTVWHKVHSQKLKNLKTFVQPYTWEVATYIYL